MVKALFVALLASFFVFGRPPVALAELPDVQSPSEMPEGFLGGPKNRKPAMRMAWPLCARRTSSFGYRVDPFTGRGAFHAGIDLVDEFGTKIRAAHAGKVVVAERRGPYGLLLELQDRRGYATRYGQLQQVFVKPGDNVSRGQVIAALGSSGRSTGPHLHFEVWYRDRVWDPMIVLRAKECALSRRR